MLHSGRGSAATRAEPEDSEEEDDESEEEDLVPNDGPRAYLD